MRAGGPRRALLSFLQYNGSPAGNQETTLRLVCFPGCALPDLRPLLAPFGLSLRPDGTGHGHTPAGPVLCVATGLASARPLLTLWKAAAVERAVLAGVFKKENGLLGILPVTVFKEVLWPWVKLAVRSTGDLDKAVSDAIYFRENGSPALSLSDSSDGLHPLAQDQGNLEDVMSESEDSNSEASEQSVASDENAAANHFPEQDGQPAEDTVDPAGDAVDAPAEDAIDHPAEEEQPV